MEYSRAAGQRCCVARRPAGFLPIMDPKTEQDPRNVAIGCMTVLIVLLSIALLQQYLPELPGPGPDPSAVDRVTYVYEKDDGAVPDAVEAALAQLNSRDILATAFEEDTVNGVGKTPAQYEVALAAAAEVGLPALVAQAGATVIDTVKSPTAEDVSKWLPKSP